jgi:hypothetical protein
VGLQPVAALPVDINGDVAPDLLVVNRESATFSVLINNGYGTLQGAVHFPTGTGPTDIAAGDFNRDGHVDVVTTNALANTISVRLGDGTGSFGALKTYSTSARPSAVLVDDFDRDGKLDVAIANAGANSVSIRLGIGNGTFGSAVQFATAGSPSRMRSCDFNRDGRPDLVVATLASRVSLLPGTGAGRFGTRADLVTRSAAQDLVASDLDGDGKVDLAVLSGPSTVSIFKGGANSSFEPRRDVTVPLHQAGAHARALAAGDFDRDGRVDLLVGVGGDDEQWWSGRLVMLRNTTTLRPIGNAYRPAAMLPALDGRLAVVDVNRDQKPDLLSDSHLFLGSGDGTLAHVAEMSSDPVCWSVGCVAAGDFNRDGRLDLARAVWTPTYERLLSVLLGKGDGTFTALPDAPISGGAVLRAGDFDNDGRLDLISTGDDASTFLAGRGDGTFDPAVEIGIGGARWVDVVDINGDGNLDVLYSIHEVSLVLVMLGRGDGTFVEAGSAWAEGDNVLDVAIGDFNRDGTLDLASTDIGVVSVMLGRADGSFARHLIELPDLVPDSRWAHSIATADFNRDGRLDLALGILAGYDVPLGAVQILHGVGDGDFVPGSRVNVATQPASFAVSDFNGDGAVDLAAGGNGWPVAILLNAPRVAVTSPNTAVNWGIGSAQPIEWRHTLGAGAPFRIEFSRDGGVSWRVLAQVASAGASSSRYWWKVDEAATLTARIRVVSIRDSGDRDASNVNFTVAAPFMAISSPTAPVTWPVGSVQTIAWSHNLNTSAAARIELSRDNGVTWSTLAAGVPHSGTTSSRFRWTVTGPATTLGRVRVSWTANPLVSGVTRSRLGITSAAGVASP